MFLCAAAMAALAGMASADLIFSAGFSDDAVFQRSPTDGAMVYGFVTEPASSPVMVAVSGTDGKGQAVSYKVPGTVSAWAGGADIHPSTPPPPPHGKYVWRAQLKPQEAGGSLTITASNGAVNGTATIARVTHGDVWFCSGQSNMALETYRLVRYRLNFKFVSERGLICNEQVLYLLCRHPEG